MDMNILDMAQSLGNEFLGSILSWIQTHLSNVVYYFMAVAVIFIVNKFIVSEISKLQEQERLDINISHLLRRVSSWISILLIIALLFGLFGIRMDLVAGLTVLAGGTVIGFASINTLGNAIAGLIVMVSRPFEIGDRIMFDDQFSDVVDVALIYTKMRTLDNVIISVPNQELIKRDIDNFGKDRIIRRSCAISAAYNVDREYVENALLEAASNVEGVLKNPESYVWITELGKYAIEYTLYVFVNDIQSIRKIEADLNREVLETCTRYDIDLSTPTLLRKV
jgi:small-conductance mechanosensitive channel